MYGQRRVPSAGIWAGVEMRSIWSSAAAAGAYSLKTLVRLGSGIAVALVTAAAPAFSDVWNCQLPNHAGLWQTDDGDLVVPSLSGAHRLAIASDTLDSVVA